MASVNPFPEVLPKQGVLFQESTPCFALCKPKLMPLKSLTLEKMENLQKEAQDKLKEQDAQEREDERKSQESGMAEVMQRNASLNNSQTSWQMDRSSQGRFDTSSSTVNGEDK